MPEVIGSVSVTNKWDPVPCDCAYGNESSYTSLPGEARKDGNRERYHQGVKFLKSQGLLRGKRKRKWSPSSNYRAAQELLMIPPCLQTVPAATRPMLVGAP
jgi:hypothetical protein